MDIPGFVYPLYVNLNLIRGSSLKLPSSDIAPKHDTLELQNGNLGLYQQEPDLPWHCLFTSGELGKETQGLPILRNVYKYRATNREERGTSSLIELVVG